MYTSHTSKARKALPTQDPSFLAANDHSKNKSKKTLNVHKRNPGTEIKSRSDLLFERTKLLLNDTTPPDSNNTNKVPKESSPDVTKVSKDSNDTMHMSCTQSSSVFAIDSSCSQTESKSQYNTPIQNSTQDTLLPDGFTSTHASMKPSYDHIHINGMENLG